MPLKPPKSDGIGSYLANSHRSLAGSVAQQRPQMSLGDHETEPHGTLGNSQNRSDLATRKIFEIAQDDDVAQFLRQGRKGAPYVHRRGLIDGVRGRFRRALNPRPSALEFRRFTNHDARSRAAGSTGCGSNATIVTPASVEGRLIGGHGRQYDKHNASSQRTTSLRELAARRRNGRRRVSSRTLPPARSTTRGTGVLERVTRPVGAVLVGWLTS